MAKDTCKFNIGEIFRLVNNGLGTRLAPGVLGANYSVRSFIEELNYCVGDLALETNLEHRLYILTPDRNWLRYVKVTPEEETTGIVRIDFEGQAPVPVTLNSNYVKITVTDLVAGALAGNTLTQAVSGATMVVTESSTIDNWIVGINQNTGVWDTVNTFGSNNVIGPVMNPVAPTPLAVQFNYMNDTMCLDVQYEKVCTGEGRNVNPAGTSTVTGEYKAPDTFPKIYLPAECDIEQLYYGTISAVSGIAYTPPKGNANRLNIADMQPTTPFVVDMRQVGYSTGDPTNADYPTAGQNGSYFIDPFLIYALRLLNYTPAGAGTATDYAIPNSNDEYLNWTWTQILGLSGGGTVAPIGQATFMVDNVTYRVDCTLDNTWDVPTDDGFTIRILNLVTADTWVYGVVPSERPWQTVVMRSTRWRELFGTGGTGHNQTFYVAFNDLRLRLPDDVIEIEYVWKIPKDSYYRNVGDHVADGFTLTANTDNESLMYNRMDYANHYFSVTETPFTRAKMHQTLYGTDAFDGAGYYIQNGQQLRIVPPTSDPVALMCRAMPDKLDPTMSITDFDTTYIEVPGISTRILVSKMLYWHNITSSGSSQNALLFKADYMEALEELKKRFIGRGSQNRDNAQQTQRMPSRESVRHKAFGSLQLGEPGEY